MSEPLEPAVSLDVLRDAVERAVKEVGLREVARQVGLSPRGVTLVIDGKKSRQTTLAKLQKWYLVHAPRVLGMSDEIGVAIRTYYLGRLEGVHREYAADMFEAGLRIAHQRQGLSLPGWVEALRNRPA